MRPHKISGDDLSDEIWIKIIQFSYSHEWASGHQSLDSNSTFDLFKTLQFVSKSLQRICHDYVRAIPQDICAGVVGNPNNLCMLQWMCRQKIKIGSFSANSYNDINSMWLSIIVHMLVSCNTSEMETFDMKSSDFTLDGSAALGTSLNAEEAGIPLEVLQHRNLLDEYDHQVVLANTLYEQVPKLKSLRLMVKNNLWYRPFLENFQDTIEELELYAYAGEFDSYTYDGQQDLCEIIEGMKSLKKLTLAGEFCGSLGIKSLSLEKIDIRDMSKHSDFVVEFCICPSLQIFSCAWDAEHGTCIGLEPVTPLTASDLCFGADSRADIIVQHVPFHGMSVPETCIVSLLYKRFLL